MDDGNCGVLCGVGVGGVGVGRADNGAADDELAGDAFVARAMALTPERRRRLLNAMSALMANLCTDSTE